MFRHPKLTCPHSLNHQDSPWKTVTILPHSHFTDESTEAHRHGLFFFPSAGGEPGVTGDVERLHPDGGRGESSCLLRKGLFSFRPAFLSQARRVAYMRLAQAQRPLSPMQPSAARKRLLFLPTVLEMRKVPAITYEPGVSVNVPDLCFSPWSPAWPRSR